MKFKMYQGEFGRMEYVGDYETDDVNEMRDKVVCGEIDLYEQVDDFR